MRVKTTDAAGNQGTATKVVTVSAAPAAAPEGGGSTAAVARPGRRLDRRRRLDGRRLLRRAAPPDGRLQVSAPRKLKARAKSLPVTLTTDTAGKASFALVRSGRVVARGSKAIGAGTASYKLKLPRKAKAGKYVLKVTFTPTGGKASTSTIKVKLAGKAKAAKASASAAGRRARVSGAGAPVGPAQRRVPRHAQAQLRAAGPLARTRGRRPGAPAARFRKAVRRLSSVRRSGPVLLAVGALLMIVGGVGHFGIVWAVGVVLAAGGLGALVAARSRLAGARARRPADRRPRRVSVAGRALRDHRAGPLERARPAARRFGLVAAGGRVLELDGSEAYLLDARTGRRLRNAGVVGGPRVPSPRRIVLRGRARDAHGLRPRRAPPLEARGHVIGPFAAAGGTALVTNRDGIRAVDAQGRVRWSRRAPGPLHRALAPAPR